MSYGGPSHIERDVERVAEEEHISPSEAIEKLIRDGLRWRQTAPSPSQRLIGLFSHEEDARLLDEDLAISQEDRHIDTTRDLGE